MGSLSAVWRLFPVFYVFLAPFWESSSVVHVCSVLQNLQAFVLSAKEPKREYIVLLSTFYTIETQDFQKLCFKSVLGNCYKSISSLMWYSSDLCHWRKRGWIFLCNLCCPLLWCPLLWIPLLWSQLCWSLVLWSLSWSQLLLSPALIWSPFSSVVYSPLVF